MCLNMYLNVMCLNVSHNDIECNEPCVFHPSRWICTAPEKRPVPWAAPTGAHAPQAGRQAGRQAGLQIKMNVDLNL